MCVWKNWHSRDFDGICIGFSIDDANKRCASATLNCRGRGLLLNLIAVVNVKHDEIEITKNY